jgi:hypothetical protein
MNTSWTIERLTVKPTEGSNSDVVVTAIWKCEGIQIVGSGDTEKTYIGYFSDSCSFAPPTENFTPYPDLTQDQVLSWCYSNGVDQAAIEANVSLQIENQINPPIIAPPLPWLPPTPEVEKVVAPEATVVEAPTV